LTSEESLKALAPYSLRSRCRLFEEKFNRKVTKEMLSWLYRKHKIGLKKARFCLQHIPSKVVEIHE